MTRQQSSVLCSPSASMAGNGIDLRLRFKYQPACVFVATATALFCGFHPPPRPLLLLFVLLLILLALFFATRIAQSLSHIFTLFYWDWSVALLAHAYLRPFLELLVLKLVLKLVLMRLQQHHRSTESSLSRSNLALLFFSPKARHA